MIDEFSFLIKTNPEILSIFQIITEKYLVNTRIKLILSGSHIGLMAQADNYHHPLYQRVTFKQQILPFDYQEAALFYPPLTAIDKIKFYSVFGGMPYILIKIDARQSLAKNIMALFLNDHNTLPKDMFFLLGHEVKNSAAYEKVLQTLAGKPQKITDLAQLTATKTSYISNVLKVLIAMALVRKEIVFGAQQPHSKKTNYTLKDPFWRFYYYFVKKNASAHILMPPKTFLQIFIAPDLEKFIAFEFAQICQTFLQQKYATKMINLGRYWLNNRLQNQDLEIDIVLLPINQPLIFFACKWSHNRVDFSVIKSLQTKIAQLPKDFPYQLTAFQIGLFTAQGFTPDITATKYLLFVAADLYEKCA